MNIEENGKRRENDEGRLLAALRELPEEAPPPDLERRIMRTLNDRNTRLWNRFAAWVRRPVVIRFSVVPVKLVPAMLCLFLAGYFSLSALFTVTHERNEHPRERAASEGLVRLEFSLEHPGARTVALIGSFNGWHRDVGRMQHMPGSHHWRIVVDVPPGRHEYAFLVDGKTLLADPEAVFQQPDGFGSTNSIVFADYNEIRQL